MLRKFIFKKSGARVPDSTPEQINTSKIQHCIHTLNTMHGTVSEFSPIFLHKMTAVYYIEYNGLGIELISTIRPVKYLFEPGRIGVYGARGDQNPNSFYEISSHVFPILDALQMT